uniref:Uncharacterized protein n=1 Tax=Knipowitschia caucasica TaxID=637954 RepID=A0AAV2J4E6_KNICA
MNITCCDTDGCNAANQTIMVSEGSLQCYSCYYNLSECTAVTCNELEVCAMSLRNATVQLYGCVSKNLCNSNFGQRYFGELSCCDTHLCNDPTKNTSLSPITLPPTNMTTEPPTNMTTEPPTNMTTEPPTNMTTEPPTTKTTEPPTNMTTEPPTTKTTEPPTNMTTEPPTTKTTEPPTTKTTEPPTTAENIIAHVKMQIMTSGSVSEEIILDFIKQFFKDQLIDLDPSVIIKKIV